MRRIVTPSLLLTLLGLAAPLSAQEVNHWPLAKISFPIDVTAINTLNPRPVSIRFYAANPEGKFQLVANKKPDDLEQIIDTSDLRATPRRGFSYTVERSTEKEFAVQYEYGDGAMSPPTNRLTPQYRVKFDLEPPVIRATASGKTGIRWVAEDENLLPSSIRIEGRYPGTTEWMFLNTGDLKTDDQFQWTNLPADRTLEVRVYAKDRAGHIGRSTVLALGAGGGKGGFIDDGKPIKAPGADSFGGPITKPNGRFGSGFGGAEELPNNSKTKIDYVNTNKLRVKSKITQITRSGVKAAQLYVLNESTDWKAAGKKEGLQYTQETPDPSVEIDYDAPRDGLYGFIIQPISGANTKPEDPHAADPAQYLVFVDTTKPNISIRAPRVTGSGLNGPLVEIEWDAKDANENLWPEPITLEFSEDQKTWKPIHGSKMIANSGRYTWEITDKKLWKFYVRAQATDKAGNSALDETKEPTLVDLDKPSGTVEKVNPNGVSTVPKQVFDDRPGGGVTGVSATPANLPNTVKPIADVPPVGTRAVPAPPKQPENHKQQENKINIDMPDPMKLIEPASAPVPAPIPLPSVELPKSPAKDNPPHVPGAPVPIPELPTNMGEKK